MKHIKHDRIKQKLKHMINIISDIKQEIEQKIDENIERNTTQNINPAGVKNVYDNSHINFINSLRN